MNELIKIKKKDGIETVNARELHEFLEVGVRFNDWIRRRIDKYEFLKDVDFSVLISEYTDRPPSREYYISLDMAKELSMVENNDKGKQARKYFIQVEKEFKKSKQLTGMDLIAVALVEANSLIEKKDNQLLEQKPAVDFYKAVTNSKDAIDIGSASKVLHYGGGRHKLFVFLRDNGILMQNNQPYQEYIDRGYFRTIEQKYVKPDGSTHINIKTVVYQKGLDYIRKLLLQEAAA